MERFFLVGAIGSTVLLGRENFQSYSDVSQYADHLLEGQPAGKLEMWTEVNGQKKRIWSYNRATPTLMGG